MTGPNNWRWRKPEDRAKSPLLSLAIIAVLWLLILFFWLSTASAQDLPAVLQKGDPAPATGLLLGERDAQRAAEEIRAGRSMAAELETLKAALAAKDRETAQLQAALERTTRALAMAEKVIEASERVQAQYDKALKLADASSEKSIKALDRADKRIDELTSQRNWMVALGILGLAVGFLMGAF